MMQPPGGHIARPASDPFASTCAASQLQLPPLHVPRPQVMPQPPQLRASSDKWRQTWLQFVQSDGHESKQPDMWQTGRPHRWSTPPPPHVSGALQIVGQSTVPPQPSG